MLTAKDIYNREDEKKSLKDCSTILKNVYNIRVGPRQLLNLLRAKGIIDLDNNILPPYDDNVLFNDWIFPVPQRFGETKFHAKINVTLKGFDYLVKLVKDNQEMFQKKKKPKKD